MMSLLPSRIQTVMIGYLSLAIQCQTAFAVTRLSMASSSILASLSMADHDSLLGRGNLDTTNRTARAGAEAEAEATFAPKHTEGVATQITPTHHLWESTAPCRLKTPLPTLQSSSFHPSTFM